jgi:hypothetical protein
VGDIHRILEFTVESITFVRYLKLKQVMTEKKRNDDDDDENILKHTKPFKGTETSNHL